MSYTLGQAAKATGKSKMTISRAIKEGKISANKNDNGDYEIDPSELHRVFPFVTEIHVTSNDNVTSRDTKSDDMLHRIKELEIRLEITQERVSDRELQLKEKNALITDIRQERDDWKQQAQKLLLTHNPEPTTKPTEEASQPTKSKTGQAIALLIIMILVAIIIAILLQKQ
jgi:hypothetical protein